jgi:hypothetical protein
VFAHVVGTSTFYSIFVCLDSAPTNDHNDDDGDGDDAASCALLYGLTYPNFPRLAQYPNCYLVDCSLLAVGQMDVCLTTLPALVVLALETYQRLEEDLLLRACDLSVSLDDRHPLGAQVGVDV